MCDPLHVSMLQGIFLPLHLWCNVLVLSALNLSMASLTVLVSFYGVWRESWLTVSGENNLFSWLWIYLGCDVYMEHFACFLGYSYLYIQHYPGFRCVFYFLTDWVSSVADNVPTLLSGCLVSAAYLFYEIGSSILLPLMEQEREPTIKSILPNLLTWLEVCTYTAIRSCKVFIHHSLPVSSVFWYHQKPDNNNKTRVHVSILIGSLNFSCCGRPVTCGSFSYTIDKTTVGYFLEGLCAYVLVSLMRFHLLLGPWLQNREKNSLSHCVTLPHWF